MQSVAQGLARIMKTKIRKSIKSMIVKKRKEKEKEKEKERKNMMRAMKKINMKKKNQFAKNMQSMKNMSTKLEKKTIKNLIKEVKK